MSHRHNHRHYTPLDLSFFSFHLYLKTFPFLNHIIDFLQYQHWAFKKHPYLHRHQIMNHYQQWYDRLRFVENPLHPLPTSNLKIAIRHYLYHRPASSWGSLSELNQDSFLFFRVIGYMLSNKKWPQTKPLKVKRIRNQWELFVRMTHQHPRSIAAGYLLTYWMHALRTQVKVGTISLRKRRFREVILASLKALKSQNTLMTQVPYFAQLFQSRDGQTLNIESMPESVLPRNDYVVDNLLCIAYVLLKRTSKRQMIEQLKSLFPKQSAVIFSSLVLAHYLY